ncbi:hypothetical protein SFC08_14645 [Lysinibacillus halotolerans]
MSNIKFAGISRLIKDIDYSNTDLDKVTVEFVVNAKGRDAETKEKAMEELVDSLSELTRSLNEPYDFDFPQTEENKQ